MHRVVLTHWEKWAGERIEAYRRRLREAGLEPVGLNDASQGLAGCTGLVLSGGIDIDPALYGEERQPEVTATLPPRDALELALLQEALSKDLPVLAICRGHQLLNVCLGGSLLQHVTSGEHESQADAARSSAAHDVALEPGGRLHTLYGQRTIAVNSRHHQAVTDERLAPGLSSIARSQDGLIEAVTSERHTWVVGVQWHPERKEPTIAGFEERSRALFDSFASAVRSREKSRT